MKALFISIILLPNGNIVSSTLCKNLKIWDITNDFKCLKTIYLENDFINSGDLILLYNGNIACSANRDGENYILIFNKNSYECVKVLDVHNSFIIVCLSNLTESRIAVSGAGNFEITIWDIDSYNCVKTIREHKRYCY
jgi:WD40 repeat protein